MSRSAPLTVIVPVYNEGANLRDWWDHARPYLPPGTRVALVYDFEADDTLPVARELIDRGAPITLLGNSGTGAGAALVSGFSAVTAGPVLVSMADLADDFGALPAMLDAYSRGADIVVASRFMPGGRQIGGPRLKKTLSRWGSWSLRRLAGFPVSDATNSFRLYDSELVRRLPLERRGGFEIGFEITLKAWMAGARIEEVPCTWRERRRGQSRFRLLRWLPAYGRLWLRALVHGFCLALRRLFR